MKEKIKKGSFSGVIPMMGLFVMAAMMGFQSIPISQAISQELTDSFSDLSRVAQTKSHADLYFYNYIPTGAEYSVNQKSYEMAKDGGNVTWHYTEFDADIEDDVAVERITEDIIKENLQPASWRYLNAKYETTAGGSECQAATINYTTKVLPEAEEWEFLEHLGNHPDNLPLVVRSEVEVTDTSSSWWGSTTTAEASPMEIECSDSGAGATKFIGDSSTSETTYSWSDDWSSLGYTHELNATANRYHLLSRETAEFYKRLYDNWATVQSVTKRNDNVCDPSSSDWDSLEQQTVNAVNTDVTTPFNNAKSEVDVSGFEDEYNIKSYTFSLRGNSYTKNYDGNGSTSTADYHDCSCETCYDEDGDPYDCNCQTEKDLIYTVNAKEAQVSSNVTDSDYQIITESGWNNITFNVEPYVHDFYDDE